MIRKKETIEIEIMVETEIMIEIENWIEIEIMAEVEIMVEIEIKIQDKIIKETIWMIEIGHMIYREEIIEIMIEGNREINIDKIQVIDEITENMIDINQIILEIITDQDMSNMIQEMTNEILIIEEVITQITDINKVMKNSN